MQGQERRTHAAVRTAHTARPRRNPPPFPREENAETIRLPYVNSPKDECVVVAGIGHVDRELSEYLHELHRKRRHKQTEEKADRNNNSQTVCHRSNNGEKRGTEILL